MNKVCRWPVAQCIGLFFLFGYQTVAAQDGTQEKETREPDQADEKQVREFEEFEAEILQEIELREKHASRGEEALADYRQALIDEYRKNKSRLAEMPTAEQMPTDRGPLEKRQKIISLHLWELERLEPSIKAKAIHCDDLQEKVRMRLSELQRRNRRGGESKQALLERCQNLYQRLSELEHRQRFNPAIFRRSRGGFYEVRPDSDVEPQPEASAEEGPMRFAPGPLQDLRQPLRRILKLRWAGKSLQLDRDHWDDLFVGKSLQDVAEEVQKEFKARDATLYQPTNRSPINLPRQNLALLFENLRHFAADQGNVGSSSSGGGGSSWRQSFETDQINARMSLRQNSLDLEINERRSPERSLRVLCREGKSLRIIMIGERMLYLEQRPSGRVRLVEVYEDEMLHASGDSFMQVYAEHPDFVEVSLLPLLDHLGFIVPETRFAPHVRQRVVDLARMENVDTVKTFQTILENLDSPSFDVRERAARELEQQRDLFIHLVQDAYHNGELPLEVRTRLKRVLHQYENGPRYLDEFISDMKMLDDPRYLANLLSQLPEHDRPIIAERLEKLTGQRHGVDLDAWQTWLKRS